MKNNSSNGQLPAARPAADSPALAETISRMRHQSPADRLGLPAGNGLLKPFLQAGAVTLVLLLLLTVVPYFVAPPKAEAKNEPAPADKQQPAEQPKDPASPKTPPEAVAKTPPGKAPAGKDDILNKLGENGTKTASPKVNPLDKKDDDLLKDIK